VRTLAGALVTLAVLAAPADRAIAQSGDESSTLGAITGGGVRRSLLSGAPTRVPTGIEWPRSAPSSRRARLEEAIGAGLLGIVLGGLVGAGVGAAIGDASDPPCPPCDLRTSFCICFHGLGAIVGALAGAGVGAWLAYPSAMAFAAREPVDVAWAWLGHVISTAIGLGVAMLGWAIGNDTRDGTVTLALGIVGGVVALVGAPIAFALALDP
jgi:hypothetical protein